MSGLAHVAVWPKVSLHIDGADVVVERGQRVPAKADKNTVALLAGLGALAVVAPDADPAPVTGPVEPAGSTDSEVPVRSASKGRWVDYAVSQGMSAGEATSKTRDELADLYLGPKDGAGDGAAASGDEDEASGSDGSQS